MLLPFEHSVHVQFQLKYGRDEGTRWLIVHGFERSEMLLYDACRRHIVPFNCRLSEEGLPESCEHASDG